MRLWHIDLIGLALLAVVIGSSRSWAGPYPYEVTCEGELSALGNDYSLNQPDDLCGGFIMQRQLKELVDATCDYEDYCQITGRLTKRELDLGGGAGIVPVYEWTEIKKVKLLAKKEDD
jgi:hypothetical protein